MILVVVASLAGGQLLRAARDRIETLRAAGTSGFVAGNDLVYVAEGDPASQGLRVVAMPSGTTISRFDAATYLGTSQDGSLMRIVGDTAFLPVALPIAPRSDQYETYLQQIDLRRGTVVARVSTGTLTLPPSTDLPDAPPFPAATATSSDGRYVWLVRDSGQRGQTAQIYRFDVQSLSAGPAVRTVLKFSGTTTVRSRVIALGVDKVIVMREQYASLNRVAADWFVLDFNLNVLKSFEGDDSKRLPDSGLCSPDVRLDPTGSGWLVVCSDPSGAGDGSVVFLDGRFEVMGRVTLERSMGSVVAMAVAGDGRVYVLTDRPVVARIDPTTRTLIDVRMVTRANAWFEEMLPPVAAAKVGAAGPTALISPDGRYAYIADLLDRWGVLATIDLATARVVASNNDVGPVSSLALSTNGERLYALAADSANLRSLILLDPRSLAIVARTSGLPNAFGLAGVRGDAR
ncbi:MAG: hypothetical protein M3T56_11700 [Chloroflexota bacterium]|nr:hypothetical protein [Chloroflexota bacterium]